MNTTDIVERVADEYGLPKTKAKVLVGSIFNAISKEVKKGGKVVISGFGTFERRVRRARKGRNPYSGGSVTIPKTKYPRFKPGKNFKELVSGR